jgi:hypothetical protein
MFHWQAFTILVSASFGATLPSIPRQIRALRRHNLPVPAPAGMIIPQSLILSTVAAGLGSAFAGPSDLSIILHADDPVLAVALQMGAGTAAAVVLMAGVFVIYYGIFRRRLPADEIMLGESLRLEMGIMVRVLHGKVIEEVQFRWGLMGLFASVGFLIAAIHDSWVLWSATLFSALGFAFYYLAGVRQLGRSPSKLFIWTTLIVNLWGGVIEDVSFVRYGRGHGRPWHGPCHGTPSRGGCSITMWPKLGKPSRSLEAVRDFVAGQAIT